MKNIFDANYILDVCRNLEPSVKDPSKPGEIIWFELFSKLVKEKFDPAQIKVMNYTLDKYNQVLLESRRNRVYFALQLLRETSAIPKEYFSEQENNFVNSFAFPTKAYLDYKQSRYEDALSGLLRTLETDENLERDGFVLLQYHRVQQLHNICRIYFKTKQYEKTIASFHELLKYIMLAEPIKSFPGEWTLPLLDIAPPQLRSVMILQILEEAHVNGLVISKHGNESEENIHERIFGNLLTFAPVTRDDMSIKKWLTIKSIFYKHCHDEFKECHDEFVEMAFQFISEEYSKFDTLKRAVINDLLKAMPKLRMGKAENEITGLLNNHLHKNLQSARNFIPVIA